MFSKLENFTYNSLSLKISEEENSDDIIYVSFDILDNDEKVGWIVTEYNDKAKDFLVSNIFLSSDYHNQGFLKTLHDYTLEILKKNKVKTFSAKAFYAAETVVKQKGWKQSESEDNNYTKKI
jgi:hypothetical protein